MDRTILSLLILLAFGILMSRSFDWGEFFARNVALTALLAFALLSVLWSDFPFVAFKRWFRGLGVYMVILVALLAGVGMAMARMPRGIIGYSHRALFSSSGPPFLLPSVAFPSNPPGGMTVQLDSRQNYASAAP